MSTNVNDKSPAVEAMEPDWDKIDALVGGTKTMRAAGKRYLPQFPGESQKSYEYRLATSTLYNALGRTLENMSAKPFAEAIQYTDIDKVAVEWLDDIDQCGNNLTVFAHSVFVEAMGKGLTHILVEFPVTLGEDGVQKYPTVADENAAGVRPYLVHIKPDQILGWRTTKNSGGAEVLAMLRIVEGVEEPDGEFGTTSIQQIRVLTPGAWATYRKSTAQGAQKDEWLPYDHGTTTLDFVPLVTFYTKRTGFMTATPPLLDMADLNIKHFNSQSDQDSILHTARVPILAITGLNEEDKIEIGAKTFLRLPLNAEAKYVEHTGAAIDAGRVSLQDLENQMRAMGAELLVEAQVASTATQNNIEDDEAKCQLARMVQGLEDALDNALDIMHQMKKMEYKGSLDIFDDFSSDAVMVTAGPFMLAQIQLVNAGMVSRETAFGELQRFGILSPDAEWEVEQERIASATPAMPDLPAAP